MKSLWMKIAGTALTTVLLVAPGVRLLLFSGRHSLLMAGLGALLLFAAALATGFIWFPSGKD